MSVSPQHLQLISAVLVEASLEAEQFSLSQATRQLFKLVEDGEHDFATLKAAVLAPRQLVEPK